MQKAKNVYWQHGRITRQDRERLNGHKGATIWLTGLSGSGKTTVAVMLEERLYQRGCRAIVLDGDNVRHGLNKDLSFSRDDREENIRRISELAKLLTTKGIISITAFISPYTTDRHNARALQEKGDFIEVYLNCPLTECERRDPKGLYKRARAGELKEFTGVDDPYEVPDDAEVIIDTWRDEPDACVDKIIKYLEDNGIL